MFELPPRDTPLTPEMNRDRTRSTDPGIRPHDSGSRTGRARESCFRCESTKPLNGDRCGASGGIRLLPRSPLLCQRAKNRVRVFRACTQSMKDHWSFAGYRRCQGRIRDGPTNHSTLMRRLRPRRLRRKEQPQPGQTSSGSAAPAGGKARQGRSPRTRGHPAQASCGGEDGLWPPLTPPVTKLPCWLRGWGGRASLPPRKARDRVTPRGTGPALKGRIP
jgi:hypothetical protein